MVKRWRIHNPGTLQENQFSSWDWQVNPKNNIKTVNSSLISEWSKPWDTIRLPSKKLLSLELDKKSWTTSTTPLSLDSKFLLDNSAAALRSVVRVSSSKSAAPVSPHGTTTRPKKNSGTLALTSQSLPVTCLWTLLTTMLKSHVSTADPSESLDLPSLLFWR